MPKLSIKWVTYRQLSDVDVPKRNLATMMLQSDGALRRNRLAAVKVVFHRNIVDDQHIVQVHSDFVTDQSNLERIPLTRRFVDGLERLARVFLVVVKAAGTLRVFADIPDLYLRTTT